MRKQWGNWKFTSLERRGGSYSEQPKGIRTGEVGRLQGKLEDYSGSWKTTGEVGRLQILPMERRGEAQGLSRSVSDLSSCRQN